jgi:hypothetical protein
LDREATAIIVIRIHSWPAIDERRSETGCSLGKITILDQIVSSDYRVCRTAARTNVLNGSTGRFEWQHASPYGDNDE